MRTSEYYGVQVPELGDRADITVVSQAIIDSEDNQSGKVENMKATLSGSTISLVSESRTDKLVKYYNGLAVQFISPVNAQAGTAYKIKVDNLEEQPYNNQVEIKVGDIVNAIYGSTGFVTASSPMHNDVARKSTQIIAGKGLTGGGDLSTNRTIDIVSKNDGIIVNDNDIQLNVYDGVDSSSTTRAGSARAIKMAYDKGVEGLNKADTKLDAGSVSTEYNTAKKIEDKIKEKLDKTAIVNDLTTGGADKAGSAEMIKKLGTEKLDKGNVSENFNNAEKIVKALESNQGLKFDTILSIDDVGTKQEGYCYMFEGDIYKCIKQTEATTPESANFQPISNNKLSDRLDNLFEIIYEVPNLVFVRYGNIVVGNGGVSEFIRDFPNNQLTFNSKFLPTTPSYCSMQGDTSNTVGEMVIYKNGSYKLTNPHGSFNITWFIKI